MKEIEIKIKVNANGEVKKISAHRTEVECEPAEKGKSIVKRIGVYEYCKMFSKLSRSSVDLIQELNKVEYDELQSNLRKETEASKNYFENAKKMIEMWIKK